MPQKKVLSHIDSQGKARMVDITGKASTQRVAVAEGFVTLQRSTLQAIADDALPKGEALAVARVAGIMAAKKTGDLIPLCHPLSLQSVEIEFDLPQLQTDGKDSLVRLRIRSTARITAQTGVEMEALTAVSVAALTVYDMCKAIDKSIVIDGIRLISKTGGKSGPWTTPNPSKP